MRWASTSFSGGNNFAARSLVLEALLYLPPDPLEAARLDHRRTIPREINDDERVLDSPVSGFRLFHEYDFTVH
jgi:hypothetical protein